jgi:hypothetical protein
MIRSGERSQEGCRTGRSLKARRDRTNTWNGHRRNDFGRIGRIGRARGHDASARHRAEELSPLASLGQSGVAGTTVAPLVDAGVVTGDGVSLAIDATLYLLERIHGEDAAAEIARLIEYDRAYAANRRTLGVTRIE